MDTQLPITYRDYTINRGEHTKFEFVHNEYDGPEDHRIGTGDTLLDCMLAIDEQVIDGLGRESEYLQKTIDRLVEEDTKTKLEGSIQIENLKKDLAKVNNMLTTKEATIDILSDFVRNAMKVFEEKFKQDNDAFDYEQMEAYINMAAYMFKRSGQTSSEVFRRIISKMNSIAA